MRLFSIVFQVSWIFVPVHYTYSEKFRNQVEPNSLYLSGLAESGGKGAHGPPKVFQFQGSGDLTNAQTSQGLLVLPPGPPAHPSQLFTYTFLQPC